MEYWVSKADDVLILISDQGIYIKIDLIPQTRDFSIPTFHYSSTPWHAITAIVGGTDLAQRTRFSLLE